LEPFLDVIAVVVVEMTAYIESNGSGQIAHAVNEKYSVLDLVYFNKLVQERRRGTDPAAAVYVTRKQTF
jgi:hypothetical protein